MNQVTYDAPMRTHRGVEMQTITRAGERYAGWIIDYEPAQEWRVVDSKSGQVVTYGLASLPVARCFVKLLNQGGFEVVEDKVRDGVQTYKMLGMNAALMYALRENAAKAAYEAQTTPGPAEFDPEVTGG